ncbi:glycerate kinase [Cutibacterium avidum]|nr:glycerate kinase [Cutibacterium avidum]MCO6678871.1 glycerate kinase [Cutibacterium avidum]MDU5416192.1 glycerate kinase [Cutibacterium avidum]MDU5420225.1 glycerate kinase [Cutibacterium avidum]
MRPDPNAPVIVAVDSFKGSLSSGKACRAVARGVRSRPAGSAGR